MYGAQNREYQPIFGFRKTLIGVQPVGLRGGHCPALFFTILVLIVWVDLTKTTDTPCDVIRIPLGWVIDRSSTPIAVGNTFTLDVGQITGSNITSTVSFIETLVRASLEKHISLVPQVMKRSG